MKFALLALFALVPSVVLATDHCLVQQQAVVVQAVPTVTTYAVPVVQNVIHAAPVAVANVAAQTYSVHSAPVFVQSSPVVVKQQRVIVQNAPVVVKNAHHHNAVVVQNVHRNNNAVVVQNNRNNVVVQNRGNQVVVRNGGIFRGNSVTVRSR